METLLEILSDLVPGVQFEGRTDLVESGDLDSLKILNLISHSYLPFSDSSSNFSLSIVVYFVLLFLSIIAIFLLILFSFRILKRHGKNLYHTAFLTYVLISEVY